MKRKSFAKDECPVARSLEAVGDCVVAADRPRGVHRQEAVRRVPEVAGGGEEHPHRAAEEAGRRRGAGTGPGGGRQLVPGVRADREGARAAPGHRGAGPVGLRRIGVQTGGPEEGRAGAARARLGGRPPTRFRKKCNWLPSPMRDPRRRRRIRRGRKTGCPLPIGCKDVIWPSHPARGGLHADRARRGRQEPAASRRGPFSFDGGSPETRCEPICPG